MSSIDEINGVIVDLYDKFDKDIINKLKSFMKHLNSAQRKIDDINIDYMFNILDDGMMSIPRESLLKELKNHSKELLCFLNIFEGFAEGLNNDK